MGRKRAQIKVWVLLEVSPIGKAEVLGVFSIEQDAKDELSEITHKHGYTTTIIESELR